MAPRTIRGVVTRVAAFHGPPRTIMDAQVSRAAFVPHPHDEVDARHDATGIVVSCYRCEVEDGGEFTLGEQVNVTAEGDDTDVVFSGRVQQTRIGERGIVEALVDDVSQIGRPTWVPAARVWRVR